MAELTPVRLQSLSFPAGEAENSVHVAQGAALSGLKEPAKIATSEIYKIGADGKIEIDDIGAFVLTERGREMHGDGIDRLVLATTPRIDRNKPPAFLFVIEAEPGSKVLEKMATAQGTINFNEAEPVRFKVGGQSFSGYVQTKDIGGPSIVDKLMNSVARRAGELANAAGKVTGQRRYKEEVTSPKSALAPKLQPLVTARPEEHKAPVASPPALPSKPAAAPIEARPLESAEELAAERRKRTDERVAKELAAAYGASYLKVGERGTPTSTMGGLLDEAGFPKATLRNRSKLRDLLLFVSAYNEKRGPRDLEPGAPLWVPTPEWIKHNQATFNEWVAKGRANASLNDAVNRELGAPKGRPAAKKEDDTHDKRQATHPYATRAKARTSAAEEVMAREAAAALHDIGAPTGPGGYPNHLTEDFTKK